MVRAVVLGAVPGLAWVTFRRHPLSADAGLAWVGARAGGCAVPELCTRSYVFRRKQMPEAYQDVFHMSRLVLNSCKVIGFLQSHGGEVVFRLWCGMPKVPRRLLKH